jgi:hypothetical protein
MGNYGNTSHIWCLIRVIKPGSEIPFYKQTRAMFPAKGQEAGQMGIKETCMLIARAHQI